ncbi:hypothetical protein I0P70_11420 [Pontibacter sp. FD36]|uniref:hypothetical protein n=1 Tax=Pontibacter sp. FD36 TaxID=2789860 RepID=UPI0018AADA64|nr:hypothetical protein [Pontibacter sp. FD36]MBF8963859.1 hypothetical protein [Pontibacter sp. FD36]
MKQMLNMSISFLNFPIPQYAGSKSLYPTADQQQADILSVRFCPKFKLLCCKWERITTSAELRQSVRLLARAVAILKAELILVEIPVQYHVSNEDRQWAQKFMTDALQYTSIRQVARLVPTQEQNNLVREAILKLGKMPYEARMFEDREEALRWLMGDDYQAVSGEDFIRIPLHFNLKMIRSGLKARGQATVAVAPAQSGNPTSVPEPLPDLISIETDFVSIMLDKAKSIMNIRWKKAPQSRQYRYGMLKAARALMEHRLERLLLNNQRLGVLTLEDQGWLISTAQQMLPKLNLRKLAVITSADALQQMSSENIGKKLKQAALNHQAHYFLAEEDALEWLRVD